MKKQILRAAVLTAGLFSLVATAFAQEYRTYYSGNNSNVGYRFSASIGAMPNVYNFEHISYMGLNISPYNNKWMVGTDGNNNGGALLAGSKKGNLSFFTVPAYNDAAPNTYNNQQELTDAQMLDYKRMEISKDGKVLIGRRVPTSQPEYKLAVEGRLVAQSMYVTNPSTWADYVFAPNYKVMPLPELETYLHINKHLPYIPSAKEVEAKGYNVAEMDANLLRTVEELTLQVIELRKQVEQLKANKAANLVGGRKPGAGGR